MTIRKPKPSKTPPKPFPFEKIISGHTPGALERAALVRGWMLVEGRDPYMTRKPPTAETET